jgi:hypothetical protein
MQGQINPVDKFRNDFFDRVIQEEKEKKEKEQKEELAIKRKQANCFHKYNLMNTNSSGYQSLSCSKCGYTTTKTEQIHKNENCVIA